MKIFRKTRLLQRYIATIVMAIAGLLAPVVWASETQSMGYKPKISTPAVTTLTVYQLVPSIGSGSNNIPDESYYFKIKDGLEVVSTTNSSIVFRTVDTVDFSNATDREIDVFSRFQQTGEPNQYLITKKIKANFFICIYSRLEKFLIQINY